jgi:hypothetical protein
MALLSKSKSRLRLSTRFATLQTFRLLALALMAVGIVAFGILPGLGEEGTGDELTLKINETVEQLWDRSDGPVLRQDVDRAWLWGPRPITTSTEFYPESPSGLRTLVYYDKGRLDILDAESSSGDEWYAVGGLLVNEMLGGQVQLGDAFFVDRATPNIPLTGDFGQAQPVTYQTLAPFSNAWRGNDANVDPAAASERQPGSRSGQPVSARLGGDGALDPGAVPDSGVVYGVFDSTTGHNVAGVFEDWTRAQPYQPLYLLGHPISEAYWITTTVNGEERSVLIQAFERRVMTYSPNNPAGWQVESANVGRHYRAWRGLPEISDPEFMPLAAGLPFGEEVVGSALTWNLDPFMLAAISKVASEGDPRDVSGNGGRGLLGVHPQLHEIPALEALVDPAVNADNGARALKFWTPDGAESFDWRGVLASYYGHGNVDWNDLALDGFVYNVLETYEDLKEQYPRLEAEPAAAFAGSGEVWGGVLDVGQAAFYDPSYTTPWWERTQLLYASKGVIAPSYAPDPNGYYCVRPGYVPGERLRLRANGITITCTVGDMVADHDLHNWLLVSNWSVELSWSAFTALGLQHYNYVEVDYPGTWAKQPPPIPPPAPVEQPAAPQPAAEPTAEPTDEAPAQAQPAKLQPEPPAVGGEPEPPAEGETEPTPTN